MRKVCAAPGCPALVDAGARGGRCATHRREADKARGTNAERGYGPEHRAQRASWQRRIDAGEVVVCWRPGCSSRLLGRLWHLGHDDQDRSVTRGPECIPCNLSHAGQASHRAWGDTPSHPRS